MKKKISQKEDKVVTESYLDEALGNYATKEYMDDFKKEIRSEFKRHTGILLENFDHKFKQSLEVIVGTLKRVDTKSEEHDDLLENHEQRILTLELK